MSSLCENTLEKINPLCVNATVILDFQLFAAECNPESPEELITGCPPPTTITVMLPALWP